jgi:hypothetical protein
LQSPFSSGGSQADLISYHRSRSHRSLPAGCGARGMDCVIF